MKRLLTPKEMVSLIGFAHLLGLYGYGMLHAPWVTCALTVAWIRVGLFFWREGKP